MNDIFDDLARGLAQSVTRRGALKKFGFGLAGIALALFGLANKSKADSQKPHYSCGNCVYPFGCNGSACINYCSNKCIHKGRGHGGSY